MVLLALGVATLAGYTLRDGASVGTSVTTAHDVKWAVQLTTRNGLDLHPSFSPQGDAIAYANERTGSFEIYIRASSGAATDTPLTSDGGQNVQPAWSPDGRYIAYHSYSRGGIWIVPARGGIARQVVSRGSRPAWSPDGTAIAFQSDEHADVTPSAWVAQVGSTVWRVEVNTGATTQLTFAGQPSGGHAAPAWSRDGRFIAFTVFDGGDDNGAWLLDLDGNDTRQLAKGNALYELAFAPDGSAIYAAGGEAFITRLPFDSSKGVVTAAPVAQPIGGVPAVRGISIAPDGHSLLFGGIALSSHIWALSVNSDGTPTGPPRALTSDTSRRNSLAIMSPDGLRIAYRSRRGGAAPDVWVMDADGSNPRPLTFDRESASKPTWMRWMPDSKRLLYLAARNGTLGMWTIDVATGREELIQKYGSAEQVVRQRLGEMQVSPSGKQLALSLLTPPDGRKRLFVSTVDRIEPQPLLDTGAESIGYPAWSPDERHIAVELKQHGFTHAAVIEPASGTLEQLTNARGHTWIRSWSPDGDKLAAAVLQDGRWSLAAIDAATGHQTAILEPLPPDAYVRYPEWSSSNVIVFERGELRGNIWSVPIRK
jgi:Tol biopolymer transport system component